MKSVILFISFLMGGCYSFSGISISPEVKTYYVSLFQDNTDESLPNLAQNMSEALKEKIRTESRLVFIDIDPDVEFKGTIVDYRISSEAPRPGEISALNRLTIVLSVEYLNNKTEGKGWTRNFQFFYDFSSDTDFSSIQDIGIRTITNQIMEDIFNAAFADW
jgi:hypothetical protein